MLRFTNARRKLYVWFNLVNGVFMSKSDSIALMYTIGAVLAALGIIITIVALNTNTSNNGTLNIGLLFSQFEYVVIGCFVTLIGSVFIARVNGQSPSTQTIIEPRSEEENKSDRLVKCKNCFSYIPSDSDICEYCKVNQGMS